MTHLKVGDPAPLFTGITGEKQSLSLSDFRGKKVLLFFYPKDNTPGCTAQACNLTENRIPLEQHGIVSIGVSMDTVRKHQNFTKKYNLSMPLIADEDREIINAYGVWGKKQFMGRTFDGIHRISFLIDENGFI